MVNRYSCGDPLTSVILMFSIPWQLLASLIALISQHNASAADCP
jgi:hypothetical protein